MGSIHDRRAAAARQLVELDERDLDVVEPLLAAVRCQARVRRLAIDGGLTSPELAAVALAEAPISAADAAGLELEPEPDAVARRCPTCRDVVVAGVCGCDRDVDDAIVRALQAEAEVDQLAAVSAEPPAPPAPAIEAGADVVIDTSTLVVAARAAIHGRVIVEDAHDLDLEPGARVFVIAPGGSRAEARAAWGRIVGHEINERTGRRWALVGVDGTIRSYQRIGRVV